MPGRVSSSITTQACKLLAGVLLGICSKMNHCDAMCIHEEMSAFR